MSYEHQLKYERLKESMYNLMAENPQTRRMLMQAFNLSKDQLSNHLQRLIDKSPKIFADHEPVVEIGDTG